MEDQSQLSFEVINEEINFFLFLNPEKTLTNLKEEINSLIPDLTDYDILIPKYGFIKNEDKDVLSKTLKGLEAFCKYYFNISF